MRADLNKSSCKVKDSNGKHTIDHKCYQAKMYKIAQNAHKDQTYGLVPYIRHIEDVGQEMTYLIAISENLCGQLITHKDRDIFYSIAAGHDLVEDTNITLEYLEEEGFPPEIVKGISAMTKQKGESLIAYIDRLKETSEYAILVKKADAICNLRYSVMGGNIRRVEKYTETLKMLVN